MAQKIKQEEEFEKERDELLMRIEMSRAKEPWLKQCWEKEIDKCVEIKSVLARISSTRSSSR